MLPVLRRSVTAIIRHQLAITADASPTTRGPGGSSSEQLTVDDDLDLPGG
jgi:hypothetical protein